LGDIETHKIKWEKQKNNGKTKFILCNGIFMMVIISILGATFHIFVFNRTLLNNIKDIVLIYLMYIIVYGLLGIALGNKLWNINIKKFKR